ncbi:MAG: DUF4402 domain-containing protein [Sphingomonas bacterium]|nr:DUF4402 domain-containing protein [Sphingomonas bacterium]
MKIGQICVLLFLLGWHGDGLHAAPISATGNVQVRATVVKPLALTAVQNLTLGTVILAGPGIWTGASVRLSRAGALACSANLICSGASQVAKYRVSGSNKQTISITAPPVTLRNSNDVSKTLTLSLDAPLSLFMSNSGNPGEVFSVGGTITLNSSTADSTYSGFLAVTVDYN